MLKCVMSSIKLYRSCLVECLHTIDEWMKGVVACAILIGSLAIERMNSLAYLPVLTFTMYTCVGQ